MNDIYDDVVTTEESRRKSSTVKVKKRASEAKNQEGKTVTQ